MYQQKAFLVLRCSCWQKPIGMECCEQPKIRPRRFRSGAAHVVRIQSPSRRLSPCFSSRLTAWTLVVVYYTITCGAIVLGLKGAL